MLFGYMILGCVVVIFVLFFWIVMVMDVEFLYVNMDVDVDWGDIDDVMFF